MFQLCERVLLEIMCHPDSPPFGQRVGKKVANYYKIIKKPMELETMRIKISPNHFEHYKSVKEFIDDMILILANCYTYNPKGTQVYNAGKVIEEVFRNLLKKYLPEYVSYFTDEKLVPDMESLANFIK
ncbi:hypothetical protein CEXT_380641 [Caerostris extrusa]|uniref:Bromo domain-containing protein n=1 Tax=Caerostris extrusa TaxID=172846 RepID=A0AAV4SVH4_CAEEX|nr:hypothetical protein CEXT_380641 [Caerostris extrusa]